MYTVHAQEWNPSQVLNESSEEVALSKAVLQKRVSYIADTREDNCTCQQNLKTVQVEAIQLRCEAEQKIVHDGSKCCSSDSV